MPSSTQVAVLNAPFEIHPEVAMTDNEIILAWFDTVRAFSYAGGDPVIDYEVLKVRRG